MEHDDRFEDLEPAQQDFVLAILTERIWDVRDELHELELAKAGLMNIIKEQRHGL